jgi:hypothetical protein
MAERYSGNVAVRLAWDAAKNCYQSRITVGSRSREVCVSVPARARITHESPKALDEAARAAIALVVKEDELGAEPKVSRGKVRFGRKPKAKVSKRPIKRPAKAAKRTKRSKRAKVKRAPALRGKRVRGGVVTGASGVRGRWVGRRNGVDVIAWEGENYDAVVSSFEAHKKRRPRRATGSKRVRAVKTAKRTTPKRRAKRTAKRAKRAKTPRATARAAVGRRIKNREGVTLRQYAQKHGQSATDADTVRAWSAA